MSIDISSPMHSFREGPMSLPAQAIPPIPELTAKVAKRANGNGADGSGTSRAVPIDSSREGAKGAKIVISNQSSVISSGNLRRICAICVPIFARIGAGWPAVGLGSNRLEFELHHSTPFPRPLGTMCARNHSVNPSRPISPEATCRITHSCSSTEASIS